jgi:hypothetical protein
MRKGQENKKHTCTVYHSKEQPDHTWCCSYGITREKVKIAMQKDAGLPSCLCSCKQKVSMSLLMQGKGFHVSAHVHNSNKNLHTKTGM